MNSQTRALAIKVDRTFDGAESCAWTIHHPGQLTIAAYHALDQVDPRHITGLARVHTRRRAFECVGLDQDGWLVRAELSRADIAGLHRLPCIQALFSLPFMRLVMNAPASGALIRRHRGLARPVVPR